MIRPNADRNQRIYRLWEKGYTIDQAAAELPDIPRSSIGYYYRKFTRYAKKGLPIAIPQRTQDPQERSKEAFESVMMKLVGIERIMESLHSGEEAEYAYHVVSLIKMMKELNLFATPEEAKALLGNMGKAIQVFLNAARKPAQTMPQVPEVASKQGLSLDEAIAEAQKSVARKREAIASVFQNKKQ
jgi:hypothetical protein